jgi:hypothetical protein
MGYTQIILSKGVTGEMESPSFWLGLFESSGSILADGRKLPRNLHLVCFD